MKNRYNSDDIVSQLSVPMQKWAAMGFMRGFAGIRSEVLPKGKMILPSAAFTEIAKNAVSDGNPSEEELEIRKAYVADVDLKLRQMQGDAINKHFKFAAIGQLFDIGMAVGILALIAGLLIRVGPMHPLTMSLIFLLAVKLLFVRHSAKRVLNIAQVAFKSKADKIRLPWMS